MNTNDIIHDGVSIKIRSADEPDKVIIQFTDDITAYYKIKKAVIKDKGIYCAGISSIPISSKNLFCAICLLH